jgi:carboxymethylenebutenolidase
MQRLLKLLLLLFVVAVILAVAVSRQSNHTVVQATGVTHSGHGVTPVDQITAMADAGDIHAGHALDEMRWAAAGVQAPAAPANRSLPADDAGAAGRLSQSPRKSEYVKIDVGGTPMTAWVVQPQGQGPAPVVIVIQEIFGLSDWIRAVADQLAAEGFIAVAPDLLSGHGPNGGDSRGFANPQEMTQATLKMPASEVMSKLKGAREWGLKLPRANGKSASVGFCFGGSQSFALAVNEPALSAAVVYYGAAPTDAPPAARGTPPAPFAPSASLANIKAPVLGLYGGMKEDARIGSTIEPTRARMKELGRTYEPHVFDGAAHGFLRAQGGNEGANLRAAQQAWPLTVGWIRKYAS